MKAEASTFQSIARFTLQASIIGSFWPNWPDLTRDPKAIQFSAEQKLNSHACFGKPCMRAWWLPKKDTHHSGLKGRREARRALHSIYRQSPFIGQHKKILLCIDPLAGLLAGGEPTCSEQKEFGFWRKNGKKWNSNAAVVVFQSYDSIN